MFTSPRSLRRFAVLSALLSVGSLGLIAPAAAAPKAARYSLSFQVLESYNGSDYNVLRAKITCPAGTGLELDVSVALDASDPDYDPTAVPSTGATTTDRFPAGFPLYWGCTGKPQTGHVELFRNYYGYDIEGEGPCIGYCYYDFSPLLRAGQKVSISYSAIPSTGPELQGASRSRVKK